MKTSSIKLSNIVKPNKNTDDSNFNRKSGINEKKFEILNDEMIVKHKDHKTDCELFINNNLKKKIIVASHERSGTHFLMNSIAYNSDYTVHPFVPISNLSLGTNLLKNNEIYKVFSSFENYKFSNICKSHHHFNFFKKDFDYLKKHFYFIYVYRDPRDIMVSFWNFLKEYPWVGPKKETINDFLKSRPEGSMIQYQLKQSKNILDRWESHIKSWIIDNDNENKKEILFVKYEDLNLSYEETLNTIFKFLNIEKKSQIKPSNKIDVLSPGRGKVGNYRFFLNKKDVELISKNIKDVMEQLGYYN